MRIGWEPIAWKYLVTAWQDYLGKEIWGDLRAVFEALPDFLRILTMGMEKKDQIYSSWIKVLLMNVSQECSHVISLDFGCSYMITVIILCKLALHFLTSLYFIKCRGLSSLLKPCETFYFYLQHYMELSLYPHCLSEITHNIEPLSTEHIVTPE